MNDGVKLISSLGLGAGLEYLLDPDLGRRRRSLVRDQLIHALHVTGEGLDATRRDLPNRTRGLVAGVRTKLGPDDADDVVIAERVRAKLGRLVRHPGAIEVAVVDGQVTLGGAVLADEVDQLRAGVASVRGVRGVKSRLVARDRAGDEPDLQGNPPAPTGEQPEFLQARWSPTARLLAGLAGGALTAYAMSRRGVTGLLVGGFGVGLFARGLTNLELKRLVGIGAGRRAIDIQKSITIATPVEDVFQLWTNYERFPRLMANVREVRDSGDGRSHWSVSGPAGVPVNWDAVVTRLVPNEIVAWKTVDGSPIAHAGIAHFQPIDGRTQVDLTMSYNPPLGGLGHLAAAALGADPKRAMDEDLVRMKSLLELGKTSVKGQTVTREALR